jgi:hypothetical protein
VGKGGREGGKGVREGRGTEGRGEEGRGGKELGEVEKGENRCLALPKSFLWRPLWSLPNT